MSWEKVKLGEISLCIQPGPFGSQLHNSDYADEGTPIVMPKDMVDGHIRHTGLIRVPEEHVTRLQRHQVYEGNLMVARKGDVRKCVYITQNENGWLTGSDCLKVALNESCCFPKYIYYQLRSPYIGKWLEQISIGATMPSINTGLLSSIEIYLPPLDTQRRISDILSTYDDLIENNRKQIKLLEEAAQRLYQEWFIDLRFPGHEHTKIVDGVPEGWTVNTLKNVADLKAGGDKPKEFSESVSKECYIPIFSNGVTDKGLNGYTNKAAITKPSVTITARGTVGVVFLRRTPYFPIVRLISATPKDNIMDVLYLYLYLANQSFRATGAAQQQITVPLLSDKKIICPTKKTRESFYDIVLPIFNMIDILENKIEKSKLFRNRLLPKLMSGEVEV